MKYKLVAFDVDGTLVDNVKYSWQLFHEAFKVDPVERENARIDYYSKKISYLEWAEHDIGMWVKKGIKKQDFIAAMKDLRIMNGAIETLHELKKRGLKLIIISGSINIIIEQLLPDYQAIFDDVFISRLSFDKYGNICDVKATAYDMEHKATALKLICKRENISLKECVFIGDHHNDVMVAKEAGLSIAFNCQNDDLKNVANVCIEKKDLREILKLIT